MATSRARTPASGGAHPAPGAAERTDARARRAASVRTALALASVALFFFVGVIASHLVNGPLLATGYVGLAALVFLGVAIARLLRGGRRGR